jgi:hypothetical protein
MGRTLAKPIACQETIDWTYLRSRLIDDSDAEAPQAAAIIVSYEFGSFDRSHKLNPKGAEHDQ